MRLAETKNICFLILIAFGSVITCAGQSSPEVLKVEPPSWWAGSSLNPVRLLIRGTNLIPLVHTVGPGWRVVGAPWMNEQRTALFVDV